MEKTPIRQTQSKKTLLLILLTPVAILLMSTGLYFFNLGWVSGGVANKGQLIGGEVSITEVSQQENIVSGRWHIVLVNPTTCTSLCLEAASRINSVRKLLGKNSPRLVRLIDTDKTQVSPEATALAEWDSIKLNQVRLKQLIKTNLTHYALLVDPNGNIVLLYALDQVDADLLTDLKLLLKVSQIG